MRYNSLREELLVLNAWALFFGWDEFSQKKSNICSLFATTIAKYIPHPKSTIISPVLRIAEVKNVNKHNKTKIGVGSVVKTKVGELGNITR